MVRGKLAHRVKNPNAPGGPKRADYILYGPSGIPLVVIEAKRAIYEVGHGMQQALDYAEMLDAPIAISSMTEFKPIVGRGTHFREDYNKLYFTIMDFKGATRLFQDPDFDGEPVTVYCHPNPGLGVSHWRLPKKISPPKLPERSQTFKATFAFPCPQKIIESQDR